jgi:hypothetical protein
MTPPLIERTVLLTPRQEQALAKLGDPSDVLAELAARVADGFDRPGSWERGWLRQAFMLDVIDLPTGGA